MENTKNNISAAIITIGDEILIGQILDSNSQYIASELNRAGIEIKYIFSISDKKEAIADALDILFNKDLDLIITTGGLGPTNDDITKYTLAEYFKSNLVLDQESLNFVRQYIESIGKNMSERNKAQALVPDNCTVLKNHCGTAPGMIFNKAGKFLIALPGVPSEVKPMIREGVLPFINKEFGAKPCLCKTLMTTGIGESDMADKLAVLEEKFDGKYTLAYLPSPALLRLRLTSTSEYNDETEFKFIEKIDELKNIIGAEHVFSTDEEPIEQVVGHLMKEKRLTLSTAESCTGGAISSLVCSVPGASGYFMGSVVAYSNNIKTNVLGVRQNSIYNFGAVSQNVVEEMAIGARDLLKTDYAIATSGIAGPDGGTEQKPVGTIWIAIASKHEIISKCFKFGKDRDKNIRRTKINALNMLRNMIHQKKS